ncbi:MAG: hypothetical protein ACXAEX_10370 [Promethearchaeota archaeon]|jgi:hypothetical protein
MNFVYFNNFSNQTIFSNNEFDNRNGVNPDFVPINLETASDITMLQNPFIKNLDSLLTFFENNYKSSLDLGISTYFRFGDTNGIITDDTIYSEDNLILYNSLMKSEISEFETFDLYLKLKSTPLWYESNDQRNYGFVNSVDNSTGEIKDDTRYLINNLLPIFLLIENIGDNIDDVFINGQYPTDIIEEIFLLIDSSEFWDELNNGFALSNSSASKHSESNFYAVLANLQIHKTYSQLNLNATIKNRAYYLANETMTSIQNFMWDDTDKAFRSNADTSWDPFAVSGGSYYHLDVNALGIISLLEFWVGSGMKYDSDYLLRAIELYNSLDDNLWDSVDSVYYNIAQPSWTLFDPSNNLNANALMMEACLKLFELTGNITYYNRAIEIFNSFENNFYDSINNAYDFSLTNSSKNFRSNLMLSGAYLKANEIYSSTILDANYNVSASIPNFVFNQDVMNITSYYSFEKNGHYYNLSTDLYEPFNIRYNITDVDINYLFKYPNGTFLYQFEEHIISPADLHTLLHPILETLPIAEGYYIYIWANTTYFSVAENIKRFNVTSGLLNEPVEGLISLLYQGPILNITLPVNYTRRDNLSLTASLVGKEILNFTAQVINFTASIEMELIYLEFNLTAKPGAIPGLNEIVFQINQGNILYLEVIEIIEIGYSFDYEHLIYQSRVVSGDNLKVSLDLINFLPNATQALNISFTGISENIIEPFIQEETLAEKQTRTVSYYIKTLEDIRNDTIKIEMNILQNSTVYYTTEMTVEIIPKFQIISVSLPEAITQGSPAHFIAVIQNNQENSEEFSLDINGKLVQANINELIPGENRIVKIISHTNNPYEFGSKIYRIIIKDNKGEEIARFYFRIYIELSTFNLVIFYLLPAIIPIGILIFFVNKEIKHKKLRR